MHRQTFPVFDVKVLNFVCVYSHRRKKSFIQMNPEAINCILKLAGFLLNWHLKPRFYK